MSPRFGVGKAKPFPEFEDVGPAPLQQLLRPHGLTVRRAQKVLHGKFILRKIAFQKKITYFHLITAFDKNHGFFYYTRLSALISGNTPYFTIIRQDFG
jgi:hypothetical protein